MPLNAQTSVEESVCFPFNYFTLFSTYKCVRSSDSSMNQDKEF